MARLKRKGRSKRAKEASATATPGANTGKTGLKLPSPNASTNLVIADVVLRAAGGLLRDRMEKGLLTPHYGDRKARHLVDKRGFAASAVLWGASRIARRSPIGFAVVVGGLAAKIFYDRGKGLETQRTSKKSPKGES